MISARVMFWNTRGQSVTPTFALRLAFEAGADIFCVAEPSGGFARATHNTFEKVTLPGTRQMYVFHNDAYEVAWSRTHNGLGNSGEAGCIKFVDGDDAVTIGFCHAQFTAKKRDGSTTEAWMGSFENWLKLYQADMYLGDTNMGRLGAVPARLPRQSNSVTILGDRGTTNGHMPYDKGKLLTKRVEVVVAGLVLPGRLRPAPADGDHDDNVDADGNLYIEMPGPAETEFWQSDHRPIYADISCAGGG